MFQPPPPQTQGPTSQPFPLRPCSLNLGYPPWSPRILSPAYSMDRKIPGFHSHLWEERGGVGRLYGSRVALSTAPRCPYQYPHLLSPASAGEGPKLRSQTPPCYLPRPLGPLWRETLKDITLATTGPRPKASAPEFLVLLPGSPLSKGFIRRGALAPSFLSGE